MQAVRSLGRCLESLVLAKSDRLPGPGSGLGRRGGQRQLDLEGRTAAAGLFYLHVSAVRADNGADDRESKSGAAAVAAAAGGGAVERLEDVLELGRLEPWTVVDH